MEETAKGTGGWLWTVLGRFWAKRCKGQVAPFRPIPYREKERPSAKGLAVRDKTGEDGYKAEGKRKGEGGGARRPHT
ncbi:hypothetical protein F2Q70_00016103 [Brassica cretica]|uniref:Uncharacterized protein n=1 Tax=Brassica cretica TaxID=69181 RepID=A0A8S9I0J2_BRACR|nr:hypothetical protein F2Q70_00016103 [Brassica cretica]